VSINVTTFGTGALGDDALSGLLAEEFDCRPAAILETLNLRAPIFRKTTNYGHFGRENAGLRWENTDRAEALRQRAGV